MNKKIIGFILFISALLFPLFLYAKSISLYEEPKDTAKIVASIDLDIGVIPIFSPEKSDWIKVADPRNGNVGWVKMKDLGSSGTTQYTFTQRFINTGKSPQSYQIIQFGGPEKMSPEQVQNMLKKTETQQLQVQENINKAMQNMMNDMNDLYRWNSNWFNNGMPLIMPVIVIPAGNMQNKNSLVSPSNGNNPLKTKDPENN